MSDEKGGEDDYLPETTEVFFLSSAILEGEVSVLSVFSCLEGEASVPCCGGLLLSTEETQREELDIKGIEGKGEEGRRLKCNRSEGDGVKADAEESCLRVLLRRKRRFERYSVGNGGERERGESEEGGVRWPVNGSREGGWLTYEGF